MAERPQESAKMSPNPKHLFHSWFMRAQHTNRSNIINRSQIFKHDQKTVKLNYFNDNDSWIKLPDKLLLIRFSYGVKVYGFHGKSNITPT